MVQLRMQHYVNMLTFTWYWEEKKRKIRGSCQTLFMFRVQNIETPLELKDGRMNECTIPKLRAPN